MKMTEAVQNPAQFKEAIWSRKQYLDTARGHYLSALAGLSGGKQEQTKISCSTDSSLLLLEDNVCYQAADDQASPGQQLQEKTFSEPDVRMQLPNGVLKTSEKDLQAVKLQLHKTLAKDTKSQITEMICKLGSFGKEIGINDAADFQTTRIVSSESDYAMELLPKTMVESSSLHRMVESLKTELENLKKEHAELNDIDAGEELAARSLHFRFIRSKIENGGCLAKRDKTRQTSEEVTQDKDVINDLKIKAKGLKRECDAAKSSTEVEKRTRIVLDVDEGKEGIVSSQDEAKSFPEGIHPACVSTSESSARFMISEDELESSSQQVGNSGKTDRETSFATTGEVEAWKCDNASEFSIRDFVFGARNRDISMNWPFSQKNLQLCLKHGVKDVLPPFQPMDCLRESSMNRCLAETNLPSEESNLDEKQSMLKNPFVAGTMLELDHSWNQDLAEGYRDSDSFPTGGERDVAFKTNATANSQSEVESVSMSNLPLSEGSDERDAAGSAANNKTNSSASQLSIKKCKMGTKMRVTCKRNTPEDITSACTAPPEVNSSKICPVCENFSSSSNTTLNAHIDQCLSSQSPPIWMKSSKLNKPRIKPRKIRLMTDICATAPCCTLEDLDRRNGTNWATNVEFPLDDADVPAERKSPGLSSRYLINNADDGSVYIDSSGRKIRILSKFNDTSLPSFSKAREDQRPMKQSRKGKRSKFFSPNRNKRVAKHLKYIKVTRQRKRSLSLKVKSHSTEACGPEEAMCAMGVEQQPALFVKGLKAQEQTDPGVVGTAGRCISLLKNGVSEAFTKPSTCEVQAAKDSFIGNDHFGSAEVEPRRTPVKKQMYLSKRSLSSIQSNLKTPINPAEMDQESEGSRRVLGGRSLRSVVRGSRDALVSLKSGVAHFNRKIARESGPKSSDSTTALAPRVEVEADIQPNALQNAVTSFAASRRLLRSNHVDPSERVKFHNSKTMLSPNRSCVRVCQANSQKRGSALEDSRDCSGDKEVKAWSADSCQQSGAVIGHTKCSRIINSLDRSSLVQVRQKQALEYGQNGSKGTSGKDELPNHSMKGLCNDRKVIASVSCVSLANGVNESSLRTAFNPELEKAADVSSQTKLLQCSDKFRGPLCRSETRVSSGQPGVDSEHDMLYGNIADTQRLELKSGDYVLNFGHGSFFPEVDPIPIPGPPGSDLPSFSDMGSEDLHRSSLSSSLAQSSGGDGDDDDVINGDISESPFSATSPISNLGRSRTDGVVVNKQESFSASPSVPDDVYPGWLGVSFGPLPGIPIVSSQVTAAASERLTCVNSSEKGMIDIGGGPAMLNCNSQQCCCSQKEEITQSTMTSQESQFLAWRPAPTKSFSGGNHAYSALDRQSVGHNDRNAVLSSSSYRRTESVSFAHTVETSHQSITSLETSTEVADPFSRTGDFNYPIPSAPILRLMGKDLRVSNQMDIDLSSSQAAINAGMNKMVKSLEPQSSQNPAFVGPLHGQDSHFLPARHFDVVSSNVIHGFVSHKQASGCVYHEPMHASFSFLGAEALQR